MKLIFGIKVAIIGMGVVFFALILLVLFIKVMGTVVALYEKRKAPVKSGDIPTKPVMNREEPVERIKDGDEAEDEVTVAICAALAAYSRNK
ncbi:MAG: OadG family protein [Smithella sp.]